MSALLAARMGDSVGAHGSSFWAGVGLVAGLAVGAALGAAVIVLTGGLAAPAIVGALFMASAVVGSVAMASAGAAAGEKLGESFDHDHNESGSSGGTPCSAVKKGFDTVVIEKQLAARMTDPVNHNNAQLKEGSGTVFIGGLCASRSDDKSTCTGKVITFAKHTFIGGPKASSGAPDQETTAGFLHDLGNAFGTVARWTGLASLGLAVAAVGAAAAVGATALAVASGAGIAVSFGLSKVGHLAGAGVGSMIDSAMGYTDHRFEQFSGTAAAMGAGFLTGRTMAAGERAMGFFGRAPGDVEVLDPQGPPQLPGPEAPEPPTIDMVQGPDGVYRMADAPVGGEPAGPRALTGPAGGQRLLGAPEEPAAAPVEEAPAAADAAPTAQAPRPTADEILARSDQLRGANDEAFDELFDDSYPDAHNPDLAYTVIPQEAVPGVLENGMQAGRAFGKEGVNADNIWFSEGAPFYREGIVLSIPKARLLELGGKQSIGLYGQKNVIRVPYEKVPNGIPFDEFAVGEVVGKGYVAEIYRPPGWKGEVGPQMPTVPKAFDGLLKGIDAVQGGGARGGGGGGNGQMDLTPSPEEAACPTCGGAKPAPAETAPAPIAEGLPEGARIIDQGGKNGQGWVVYETPGAAPRIRFRAADAHGYNDYVAPGRNYSPDAEAGVDAKGNPFIFEGKHRTVGAANGDEIPPELGGVPGKPGILDYEYVPVRPEQSVPLKDLKIDYDAPEGKNPAEAEQLWGQAFGRTPEPQPPSLPSGAQNHIFQGEIAPNSDGDLIAQGYHSTADEAPNARILKVTKGPDQNGVYAAKVEITDPNTGVALTKNSTMFPDAWSKEQIMGEVGAVIQQNPPSGDAVALSEGVSPSGVPIRVVFYGGTPVTAYPIRGAR